MVHEQRSVHERDRLVTRRWSGQIDVTPAEGETVRVTVPPSARRAFETEHDQALPIAMASGRSDWIDELAFHTFRLRHGVTVDLDTWLATIDELALVMVVDDPDPGGGATTAPQENTPS